MKSAVIFGAGNIGRGFIGQLFSESGYRVVFVDVDAELVAKLAREGSYRLETVFNTDVHEYRISPVTAYHGGQQAAEIAAAVAAADIAATAVGANALKFIVPHFAAGIEKRAQRGAAPLSFIICENLKGAAAQVRQMTEAKLAPATLDYFRSRIGFVDTVIGRMVPIPTSEMRAADVSLIRVEPYKELPVDKAGFAGPVPAISAMTAYDNFPLFTARKLYIHNCGHAVLAYTGYLHRHEFGWQALNDDAVRRVLEGAWNESIAGIMHKYGADEGWLRQHAADLRQRFANQALGDTIFRLGRDPLRKLHPSDRLVASARLAEAADCTPRHLALAIAATLCFDPADDPVSVALQQRLQTAGPAAVLADVCGIRGDEPLGRLVLDSYARLRRDPQTFGSA